VVSSWCALALLAGPARAQTAPAAPEAIAVGDWQLTPLLQVRTRGEYRHAPVDLGGEGSQPVTDAFVVMQRSRLGLGAQHGLLRAQVTLQDASAWGQLPPTATIAQVQTGAQLGAYEAFVEAKTSAPRPSYVRIGRQAVAWGEGRLLGTADWSPTGRALDAVRGVLSLGVWDFELLGAVLDERRPLGTAFEDIAGPAKGGEELAGARALWTIDPLVKVELGALARVTQSGAYGAGQSRWTFARASGETYVGSVRVFGEGRGWSYGAEGAYELGRATTLGESRSAYAAAAHVAYTFAMVVLTPTLRLGGAYASGDDGSNTYKQFDPILPEVHTWHGAMDIFAWSNLVEINGRASVVPLTDTSLSLEYRYARMAEPSADWLNAYLGVVGRAPGSSSADLGHELDLAFSWQPWPVMGLVAGYSGLLLGDGARTIMAAQGRGQAQSNGTVTPEAVSHLGYVQVTVSMP
jgi:hypothetical protein